MGKLPMCRICLVKDVRMYNLVNTSLQDTYERLTAIQFQANDLWPSQICYICYARLQSCEKLRTNCLNSEKLFTEMVVNNTIEPPSLHDTTAPLTIHLVTHLSMSPQDSDACVSIGAEDPNAADPLRLVGVQVKIDVEEAEDVFDSKGLNTEIDNHVTPENSLAVLKSPEYGFEYTSTKAKGQPLTTDDNSDHTTHSTGLIGNKCLTNVKIVLQKTELTVNKTNVPVTKKVQPDEQNWIVAKKVQLDKLAKYSDIKSSKLNTVVRFEASNEICKKNQITSKNSAEEKKPFKTYVNICKGVFHEKGDLLKHTRVHTGEKPYNCDICEKKFCSISSRNSHRRIHTGEKRYKCVICERSFNFKDCLLNHIRTHTGEKPYVCNICEKGFASHGGLLRHMRVHTGEKPYKCDTCEKQFSQKDHLTNHLRMHTGEKPYHCKFCHKSYTQNGNFNKHLRTHTSEKQ